MIENSVISNSPAQNFSVLINCYNYAAYVCEAIDSVLNQSVRPIEIIVVDDGSVDGSGDRITQRYAKEPLVRLIRRENGGQLAAVITGFNASKGELIAFLDADDIWLPEYIKRASTVFHDKPEIDQVFTNIQTFDKDNKVQLPRRDCIFGVSALRTAFLTPSFMGVATSAISARRKFVAKALDLPSDLIPEFRLGADQVLNLGMAILGAQAAYIGEPLVRYRVHNKNNWNRKRFNRFAETVRVRAAVAHWRRAAGILDRSVLAKAGEEFESIERPSYRQFRDYMFLCNSAETTFIRKSRNYQKVIEHYCRSLFT